MRHRRNSRHGAGRAADRRRAEAAGISRLRFGRRRHRSRTAISTAGAPRASSRNLETRLDARAARTARSASATPAGRPTARRPRRNAHPHATDRRRRRPQRHHREFPRAARRARQPRAHVFETETDTEVVAHLVSARARRKGMTPVEAVARGAAAAARRLRARHPVRRRGRPDDRRPPRLAARHRLRRRRDVSRLRRASRSRRSPTASPISRRATGRCSPATACEIFDAAGKPVERPMQQIAGSSAAGRQGQLPPFHGQGDPRAAGGGRPHARALLDFADGTVALPVDLPFDFAELDRVCDLGLRHRLLCRPGRANTGSSASRGCRSRSMSPPSSATASRRWRRAALAHRSSRSRARPPTRWPRCATPRRRGSTIAAIVNVPTSTIARESRRRAADPGRPGDRRRLDQGLHLPARGARLPRRSRAGRARGALSRERGERAGARADRGAAPHEPRR